MHMRQWSLILAGCVLLGGMGLWGAGRVGLPLGRGIHRAQATEESLRKLPRVVVEKRFQNLGILEPNQTCEYTFLIRNEGEGPLQLNRGGTSCKCTMSHLPQGEVPPGGQVPVVVSSKVEDTKGDFSHRATILTNDPKTPRIDLQITGTIRAILAAFPAELTARANRGRAASAETIIYSEVWDQFTLQVAPGNGMTCEVLPVDPGVLRGLGARAGQCVRVMLPPRDQQGTYEEHLEVTATPSSPGESARSLLLKIYQTVPSLVALHGDKFDRRTKELHLGTIRPHEGARGRVVLVIRDEPHTFHIGSITATPPFLKVAVNAVDSAKDGPAVYAIDGEVPEDAPSSNYLSKKGSVAIETDHPEIPRIEFAVCFAVISR